MSQEQRPSPRGERGQRTAEGSASADDLSWVPDSQGTGRGPVPPSPRDGQGPGGGGAFWPLLVLLLLPGLAWLLRNAEPQRTTPEPTSPWRSPGGLGAPNASLPPLFTDPPGSGFKLPPPDTPPKPPALPEPPELPALPREVDLAHQVARLASGAKDPLAALTADADVTLCLAVPDGFFLRLHSSGKVLQLKGEAGSYGTAWVGHNALSLALERAGYLRLDLAVPPDQRVAIDANARGPPEDARRLVLRYGKATFNALADTSGRNVFLAPKDLPEALKREPEGLLLLVRSADSTTVRAAVDPSGKPSLESEELYPWQDKTSLGRLLADISSDRELARRFFAANQADCIFHIDRLLRQGRHAEALHLLADRRSRLYREEPALLYRRGLAELGRHRPGDAAQVLAHLAARVDDLPGFLNEINRRLSDPELKSAQRGYLLRAARLAATRTLRVRNKTTGEVKAIAAGGEVRLEASLPTSAKVEPAGAKDVTARDILYIDDAASLSNRDFSAAGRQQTIGQLIEADGCDLVRLHQPDPALRLRSDRVTFGPGGGDRGGGGDGGGDGGPNKGASGGRGGRYRLASPGEDHLYRVFYTPSLTGEEDPEEEADARATPKAARPGDRTSKPAVFLLRTQAGRP